jgi:hypothetical protein
MKFLRRRWFHRLILVIMVGLSLLMVWKLAHHWRERNWIEMARLALKNKNYQNAAFYARLSLQNNEENREALEIMADLAELYSVQESLPWRRRLAEVTHLEPHAVLKWASAALVCQDLPQVEQALDHLKAPDSDSLEARRIRGVIALQRHQLDVAEREFENILKSPEATPSDRVSWASLGLVSNRSGRPEKAREELTQLVETPALRLPALRSLISDAISRRASAHPWIEKYWAIPDLSVQDQIFGLESVLQDSPDQLDACWNKVRNQAGRDVWTIYRLMKWLNQHHNAGQTLEWAVQLEAQAEEVPVAEAVAEASLLVQKWQVATLVLSKQNWKERDCFRLAYLALAHQKMGDRAIGQEVWHSALRLARNYPALLWKLGEMGEEWDWPDASRQAWWELANGHSLQEPALRRIYLQCRAKGYTEELLRVFEIMENLNPQNLSAQNNVNYLNLLLHRKMLLSVHRSKALYRQESKNEAYLTTYLLALALTGHQAEAWQLFQLIPPSRWPTPEVGPVAGLILKNQGESEDLRKLQNSLLTQQLLPQENEISGIRSP